MKRAVPTKHLYGRRTIGAMDAAGLDAAGLGAAACCWAEAGFDDKAVPLWNDQVIGPRGACWLSQCRVPASTLDLPAPGSVTW